MVLVVAKTWKTVICTFVFVGGTYLITWLTRMLFDLVALCVILSGCEKVSLMPLNCVYKTPSV